MKFLVKLGFSLSILLQYRHVALYSSISVTYTDYENRSTRSSPRTSPSCLLHAYKLHAHISSLWLVWPGRRSMADHAGEPESLLEKITRHDDDLSSSSDSDSDDNSKPFEASKSKIFRLFGREQPIHKVFGGGKCNFPSLYPSIASFCAWWENVGDWL